MAKLSREATTFRRILECLFRYFGNNSSWLPENGLALCVLLDMQLLVESSGAPFSLWYLRLSIVYTGNGYLCWLNNFCRPKYALNAVTTDKAY